MRRRPDSRVIKFRGWRLRLGFSHTSRLSLSLTTPSLLLSLSSSSSASASARRRSFSFLDARVNLGV